MFGALGDAAGLQPAIFLAAAFALGGMVFSLVLRAVCKRHDAAQAS